MIKIGIIGLPNVGKSLLFNAITNSSVESANYPFATIKPNVKIVNITDKRVDFLAEKFNSKKVIYNQIQYFDIAGLIKNASKGEGLGNSFLNNIREVDGLIHLLRGFQDKDVIHVESNLDIIRDLEIINSELIISDLEQVEKWLNKNQKKAEFSKEKILKETLALLLKVQKILSNEEMLNIYEFNSNEKIILKNFNFLTYKPSLYVINLGEEDLLKEDYNISKEVIDYFNNNNLKFKIISAKVEAEIAKMTSEEAKMFLEEYRLNDRGLNVLSNELYKLLNYISFFTAGQDETRAWETKKGSYAPDAAGVIHNDFKKGFIRADVYNYEDFKQIPNENLLKEKGFIRSEGKEYLIKDGDVCFFKFNI